MGLCILFPALCGLKRSMYVSDKQLEVIAKIEQLILPITSDLESDFSIEKTATRVEARILSARHKAITLLDEHGINPYEV